ncbi:MAG: 4Fe-4S binding protein [Candidatus Marinimicrobia bacterium]|nr:4Fe-4S binding protein [Candidatus Neomarinimicrobiota bacterium]MBL7066776.1 4Fe-4S binding protein [Candidatus Neomarinimicrobiota bacterium]
MIRIDKNRCDLCGICISVCPVDCIEMTETELSINEIVCIGCDACVKICPFAALSTVVGSDESLCKES